VNDNSDASICLGNSEGTPDDAIEGFGSDLMARAGPRTGRVPTLLYKMDGVCCSALVFPNLQITIRRMIDVISVEAM
jgi:hypothetical protein